MYKYIIRQPNTNAEVEIITSDIIDSDTAFNLFLQKINLHPDRVVSGATMFTVHVGPQTIYYTIYPVGFVTEGDVEKLTVKDFGNNPNTGYKVWW